MSIWGTGIYHNDVAVNVRDEYYSLIKRGESDSSALEIMLDHFRREIDDADDNALFWLAFADVQWKLGCLDQQVKENALTAISRELNGEYSLLGKPLKKRERTLKELQMQLMSAQPKRKQIRIVKEYKCEWADFDIYALKLTNDLSKDLGLFGKYVLIQKVGEFLWDRFPQHLNPIIRLKISDSDRLPGSIEDFNELKYIKVSARPYEHRFMPYNAALSPEEEKAECDSLRCEVDETGTLPEYMAELLITSKRSLPKDLIFVGNFGKAEAPQIEFIPRGGANGLTAILAGDLENKAMQLYQRYSL